MKLCTVCGIVTSRPGSRCTKHARQSNRSRHNALYSTRLATPKRPSAPCLARSARGLVPGLPARRSPRERPDRRSRRAARGWEYAFIGTGAVTAAEPGEFYVTRSEVVT